MTQPKGSEADDERVCPGCGSTMYVSRRSADLIFPNDFEHQTFACHTCDVLITRRIGKLAPSVRL
jgi:C4-type Zn-finger protein